MINEADIKAPESNFASSMLEAGAQNTWLRRLLSNRFIMAGAIAVGAVTSIARTPGAPYHEQTVRLLEIGGTELSMAGHALGNELLSPFTAASAEADQDNPDKQAFDLLHNFAVAGTGLYKLYNNLLHPEWFASMWKQTRVIDALYVLSLQPGPLQSEYADAYQSALTATENYWDADAGWYGPGLKGLNLESNGIFVDDNLWMGNIIMREFNNSHEPAALHRVKRILDLAIGQRDPADGLIFWKVQQVSGESNHAKCVVSNLPFVSLASAYYMATHDSKSKFYDKDAGYYLRMSEEVFESSRVFIDQLTGLPNDHVNDDGSISTEQWTYLAGTYANAGYSLYRAKPELYSLAPVVEQIKRSIESYTNNSLWGAEPDFDGLDLYFDARIAAQVNDPELARQVQLAISTALEAAPVNPSNLKAAAGVALLKTLSGMKTFAPLAH